MAGFGYRDDEGIPHSTFVGGRPGFVHVDSPKRIVLAVGTDVSPRRGSGGSFVFMLPGIRGCDVPQVRRPHFCDGTVQNESS